MVGGDEHNTILRVGKEVLGMTTGRRPPREKETSWWWNDKVQEVVDAKKEANEIWETSRRQEEGKYRHRHANKAETKQ